MSSRDKKTPVRALVYFYQVRKGVPVSSGRADLDAGDGRSRSCPARHIPDSLEGSLLDVIGFYGAGQDYPLVVHLNRQIQYAVTELALDNLGNAAYR